MWLQHSILLNLTTLHFLHVSRALFCPITHILLLVLHLFTALVAAASDDASRGGGSGCGVLEAKEREVGEVSVAAHGELGCVVAKVAAVCRSACS